MIILIIIAFLFFIYAFNLIVKAVVKIFKTIFYLSFANDKQIDEAFIKHVVKKSNDYKEFESKFKTRVNEIINPKTFEL